MNNPKKQTVYLPVKAKDELPSQNYYGGLHSDCGLVGFENGEFGNWNTNKGIWDYPIPVKTWLKPQEMFVFTPEQLNEYTQNIIKQTLETAAEKAKIKEDKLETESYKKADEFAEGKSYSYTTDMDGCLIGVNTFEIDKQSITNTFEETFEKFKV